MSEQPITKEEVEYLERCKKIYSELNNTSLMECLSDLKEQTIARIAKLDTDREVWKELGKLWMLDHITSMKSKLFNEIKRVEKLAPNNE